MHDVMIVGGGNSALSAYSRLVEGEHLVES
jgi:ribulose 1,5-bisphosphate synthetase/thiazole synthase